MAGTVELRAKSRRAFRFGFVGFTGIGVNQVVLAAFTELLGIHYTLGAVAATQFSTTWNFIWTERWAFRGRHAAINLGGRYLAFLALNNATLLARLPLLWLFTEVGGLHYLWSNAITLGLLFLVRFAIADGWIWSTGDAHLDNETPTPDGGSRRVAYSIAGILRIESEVPLRELAFFRTNEPGTPDLAIRVGRVGGLPIRRTRFVNSGERLEYLEQLGAASANFQIVMGNPIEVCVSPLLASSPHVVYTNVVEALLRFLLVSRGYVLLHSACMSVDGHAVLLSAQTDTGKTSTVIELVRDRKFGFLSDDMTIISPDGMAIGYPKPMTMSFHTMAAIRGHRLGVRRRTALAIQSRLHSKSGRSVGRRMGMWNVPIMSVNSIVQRLVPPPKYHIGKLLKVEVADRAPISHIFIMERGEPLQVRTRRSEGVERLIENTDDAYGFPPFATFAPQIRIGARDYEALRRREVQLLRRAIAGSAIWRVRVPGHEWAEVLPDIIARNGHKPRRTIQVEEPEPHLQSLPVVTPTGSDELAADRVPI